MGKRPLVHRIIPYDNDLFPSVVTSVSSDFKFSLIFFFHVIEFILLSQDFTHLYFFI